jgi:hypothetical protein
MSTHYGLHCPVHNEISGQDFNHCPEIVANIAKMAPAIVSLRSLEAEPKGFLEVSFLGDHGGILGFAETHHKCPLEVWNEYGEKWEVWNELWEG